VLLAHAHGLGSRPCPDVESVRTKTGTVGPLRPSDGAPPVWGEAAGVGPECGTQMTVRNVVSEQSDCR
jgi:hypothetical protein